MFSLEENGDGFGGFVEYNTDLFDESTIARLLGNFQTLLEGVAENPGQRLSQLPLRTEMERKQIFVDWNDTGAEFPKDKYAHQLFEEQAGRAADKF
jgi:non-ribosomal peptide synthetase component F